MIQHDTYTLRATEAGWELRLNGDLLSAFDTMGEAQQAAMSAAAFSRDQDRDVKVFVQGKSGIIETLPRSNGALSVAK